MVVMALMLTNNKFYANLTNSSKEKFSLKRNAPVMHHAT
jgi:hypothetical protein